MHILQKCVRKEIELDKYSTKIKHLNRGKLHLNQKGWKVLGVAFLKEIFNIFNWYYINENSRLNHEGCKSNFSLENDKRIEAKTILKLLRRENTNKFVHRNKFELFVNQVEGNIDVLMFLWSESDSLSGGILLYDWEDIPSNLL